MTIEIPFCLFVVMLAFTVGGVAYLIMLIAGIE